MQYATSTCPVGELDKEWIEKTLIWFEQKLGKAFVKEGKFLIPSHFKLSYSHFNSQEAIQYFIEFICGHLEIDPKLIEYKLVWENEEDIELLEEERQKKNQSVVDKNDDLIENGKYQILINADGLNDFDATFIDLVYELTYIKLVKEKVFTAGNSNGYLIDYAMVLYGFGLLTANAFIRSYQWNGLRYSAWKVQRLGLLNHMMYGYLFAVLSKYRNEDAAEWQQYLCAEAKKFYDQSCKFIAENLNDEEAFLIYTSPIKDEEVFIYKQFYEKGGIRMFAHIVNNKFEGIATFYHANGVLWSQRIYKDDRSFTVLSNFNKYDEAVEKGTLLNGNGTLYIYKADGNLNYIETYLDGTLINKKEM